jgi:hypothetical protein
MQKRKFLQVSPKKSEALQGSQKLGTEGAKLLSTNFWEKGAGAGTPKCVSLSGWHT